MFGCDQNKQRQRCSLHILSKKTFLILIGFGIFYVFSFVFFHTTGNFAYIHTDTHAVCVIPQVNPFDEDIMSFFWKPSPIVCDENTDIVYFDDAEMIHINYSRISTTQINCSYQEIIRQFENDNSVYFGHPVWFQNATHVKTDFVKVQCFSGRKLIYERLHNHIYKSRKEIKFDSKQTSVLIFGIDSMSRLAAIRELPKTINYLENDLKAYVLKGYTKVGHNSFPNIVAFLAGRVSHSKEFPVDPNVFFDKHPFIWNNFTDRGGVTMYAEDSPRLSTLNYAVLGFNHTPTDHYFRPFYLGMNIMRKYNSEINDVFMFLEDKQIKLGRTSTFCYGDVPKHVIQINYFKRFLKTYRNKLKFGMSWLNEIGHEYVNFIKLGDDSFLDFLKFLKGDGHLARSVLFFISDHGSNVDKIRNTAIGRMEGRMPFFSLVLPENLKQKYPHIHENLLTNINRLTSPFDFYETLADILTNNFMRSNVNTKSHRGISLFQKIPKERTCADANIHEHYCACYTSKDVSKNSTVVLQATRFVILQINTKLQKYYEKCATLTLKKIHEAKLVHSPLKHSVKNDNKNILHYFSKSQNDNTSRYLIAFEVLPSFAILEATVEKKYDNIFLVLGQVNRINRYGNQSTCINDRDLKMYCYCM